ncbi:MAG: cupredoxin domain-containing protein [Terracidiphilus sp.]
MGFALRILGIALLIFGLSASSTKPISPRHIEVVAKRFAFEPAEITLKRGEPVDFVLSSADVNHGVRIRELGLDLRVAKGKKAETTFTPQSTGTFVGHCSVFCGSGHGRMILTIHVVA